MVFCKIQKDKHHRNAHPCGGLEGGERYSYPLVRPAVPGDRKLAEQLTDKTARQAENVNPIGPKPCAIIRMP